MHTPKETFRTLVKANGFSITRPRLQIFEALLEQEPLAMHELIRRVPDIDRASAYRTIELFEQLGIVQRIHVGWKYRLELSDKFSAHHHHLTCTQCGRTIPINERELERFIEQIAHSHDFTPSSHQIEVQGICKDCR